MVFIQNITVNIWLRKFLKNVLTFSGDIEIVRITEDLYDAAIEVCIRSTKAESAEYLYI